MDIVANKLLMFGEEEQAAVLLMQLSLMDFDVEDDQNLELKKSNDIPKMDLVIYNPIDISKMDYGELRRGDGKSDEEIEGSSWVAARLPFLDMAERKPT
ncbi:hypothetical protein AT3G29140 [Arabidopsis thaliana]|uniref:Uncharacterized protein n=2 Tax=Arabidopsis thaliana TaxID=3702 RepID=F4J1T4_ARATH|nr:uncharacterized protein AT3G29140 [Arabidopsis thaliana]AEE77540.1 hypothetical protein AT3G29140 [Arabidopsis thaliana]|eukprot:NP_189558.1 hypothetical protein AT3G29140 [Arabidopsis thaliana]